MSRLDGKVAILTGASSGIGQAAAVLFAKQGAKVVVAARSVDGLNETLKKVKEVGGEGIAVRTDTTEEKDVKNLIDTTISTYGKLDIAFNNAGMQNTGKQIHETNLEDWEEVIRTNLRSCFLCLKFEVPQMFANGDQLSTLLLRPCGGHSRQCRILCQQGGHHQPHQGCRLRVFR
jgi:NAD(P)-dependent dehydrogenase (short-subunit alcohol dehydrogenase family)